MTRSAAAILACAGLLTFFWWQGERVIAANGPTFDEGVHLAAGAGYWQTGDFSLNREDPPLLKLWWALPQMLSDAAPYPRDVAVATNNDHWQVALAFLYRDGRPQHLLAPARRMNLALGGAVVLLSGWWAFRFWCHRLAAVGAAAFAAFDPNLLALACVLSTDCGFAFFSLLSCYLMWEYAAAPSRGLVLALGASLGLLLGTKLSSLAMLGGLGIAGLFFVWRGGVLTLPRRSGSLKATVDLAFRLGVIALIVLAATYGFVNFAEWGRGLKFQLTRGQHGDVHLYLNGELSRTGWLHYFGVVLGLKLPIGLMLAAALALTVLPRDPRRLFLLLPPVLFFFAMSASRVDLGIRVILPATVFLYPIAAGWFTRCGWRSLIAAACLLMSLHSAYRSVPYPIAFFNEFAGRSGATFLADSNLDWGQGLPALRDFMKQENLEVVYLSYFGTDRPEAYGIRFHPLPGYGRVGPPGGESIPEHSPRHVLAISVNNLLGIYLNDPALFAFLRGRESDHMLAGSIRIFDLSHDPDALRRVRAASLR